MLSIPNNNIMLSIFSERIPSLRSDSDATGRGAGVHRRRALAGAERRQWHHRLLGIAVPLVETLGNSGRSSGFMVVF